MNKALIINSISKEEDTFLLSWTINSLLMPGKMQENYMILTKTPDYLFNYISIDFMKKKLHKNYSLDMSKKSITIDIDEITFSTDNSEFFNEIKKTMFFLEKYFDILIPFINNYNSSEEFSYQINKLQLFEKLKNTFLNQELISKGKNKI